MSIESKTPVITMELVETDKEKLLMFIKTETEKKITENYLILYDFAIDCKYSKSIQSNLINELLPYYLYTIVQAITYRNPIATDIYFEFNRALFYNRKNFIKAIGEDEFRKIMRFYSDRVVECMSVEQQDIMDWIPLYNTTIALSSDNLYDLLSRILKGDLVTKYALFKYLLVIVLEEKNNLLIGDKTKEFWYSDIWVFDDGYFGRELFWAKEAVGIFDKIITGDMIKMLLVDVKTKMNDELGNEAVELLEEEIRISIDGDMFYKRKAEYLEKIACNTSKRMYWGGSI